MPIPTFSKYNMIEDITGLSGNTWSVFYSDGNKIVKNLGIGASGLYLMSQGSSNSPSWCQASGGGGGGDNLGSHEADKILDMNSYRITGLGSPIDDNDAVRKTWVSTNYSSGNHNHDNDYAPSGDYASLSGDYTNLSGDFGDVSGDFHTHKNNINAHISNLNQITTRNHSDLQNVGNNDHHRPTKINDTPTDGETTTGISSNWAYDHNQEFLGVSGDYADLSGDYNIVSGDITNISGDFHTHKNTVNAHIDNLTDITYRGHSGLQGIGSNDHHNQLHHVTGTSVHKANNYKMFYSSGDGYIYELALGTSGYALCSQGNDQPPTWTAGGGGGGDNLGNHEATKILDMNTYRITGLGAPSDDNDAIRKVWVESNYYTQTYLEDNFTTTGDLTDHAGLANIHHIPTAINDSPANGETTTGASSNWAYDHENNSSAHHIVTAINDTPTDNETTTGISSNWAYDHDQEFSAVSGDYASLSGDFVGVSGDTATALQNVVEDTSPQLGAELDLNEKGIAIDPSLGTNLNYEGFILELTVSALTVGQCVYINGNNAGALADADSVGNMPAVGVYVGTNKVLTHGVIRQDSWSWTAGDRLYVGTDGNLTGGAPNGVGDYVQIMGIAVNATAVLIMPSLTEVKHS